MSVLDEKWHAKEESGRIYDERGSCVADLCAPEAKRAAHLRFFMQAQAIARQLREACEGRLDVLDARALLRDAGVLDDVSEPKGE